MTVTVKLLICTMLNQSKVIFCSKDPVIKLFDLENNNSELYKGHDMAVTSLSTSPDQRFFVSGSRDCSTKLWDIET